jgi:hypothetical protein
MTSFYKKNKNKNKNSRITALIYNWSMRRAQRPLEKNNAKQKCVRLLFLIIR